MRKRFYTLVELILTIFILFVFSGVVYIWYLIINALLKYLNT